MSVLDLEVNFSSDTTQKLLKGLFFVEKFFQKSRNGLTKAVMKSGDERAKH